jgi:Holliday junction resolvase
MAHTEKQLWQLIKKNSPDIFWQRLESGMTAPGIPDLFGCDEGAWAFVELKCVRGRTINLTPNQVNWMRKADKAMVNARILAWRKDKNVDLFYIWDCHHAAAVAERGIGAQHAQIFSLDGADWDKIFISLFPIF